MIYCIRRIGDPDSLKIVVEYLNKNGLLMSNPTHVPLLSSLKRMSLLFVIVLATASLLGLQSLPANASTQSKDESSSISKEGYEALYSDLMKSDVPRRVKSVDGGTQVSFKIDGKFDLTMPAPVSVGSSGLNPELGAGKTKYGIYFSFNQTDQNILSNAVTTGAITAAICAIPAVGQVACAAAGVAVSVAIAYVHKNGVCPKSKKTLYWYDVKGGSTINCRSSKPK